MLKEYLVLILQCIIPSAFFWFRKFCFVLFLSTK
uniref:Uncharacterized protein n=1 Tax=Anguilla anguilla TaxID=7936 RepID=A0A0E9UTI2_ANGAN